MSDKNDKNKKDDKNKFMIAPIILRIVLFVGGVIFICAIANLV